MKQFNLEIENLKCGGCENTLHNSIIKVDGVLGVHINSETSEISVDYEGEKELTENRIEQKLRQIGYPKKGTGNNFQKAKSYVSCVLGKVTDKAVQ